MHDLRPHTSALEANSVTDWAGDGHVDIPQIPGIDIDVSRYRYLNQGSQREVTADEKIDYLGSDGFSYCSGLVIIDALDESYTLAHLEPFSQTILQHLDERHTERVRRAALFYGSLSSRQTELETMISDGCFGPIELDTAIIDTGNTHWGMVFDRSANQVKTFARKPTQRITTFDLN